MNWDMTNNVGRVLSGHSRVGWRLARSGAISIAAAALALLLAGCVETPSAAGGGAPTTGAHTTYTQDALAYARCVRSHGVPRFPDPNSDGSFPKASIPPGSGAQILAANKTCGHLLPANSSGYVLTTKDQQDYIKAAACMRSHGIGNFPDPVFTDGKVNYPIPSGISTTSTQFTSARSTCAKLIPSGLPYSTPGG
jgi:hypothetical protein